MGPEDVLKVELRNYLFLELLELLIYQRKMLVQFGFELFIFVELPDNLLGDEASLFLIEQMRLN